jgi:putative DNA-invertase from lambdoid prophage Rac
LSTKVRAALYARVSTGTQTVENQLPALQQLAQARGWEPVLFLEIGSATKSRPVFEGMLDAARRGEIAVVAVAALDRLGRSMMGILRTVDELNRVGCAVVSIREPWMDSSGPLREVLTAITGWLAQEERRLLVERTLEGLARARRQKKRIGRPPTSPVLLGAAADLVAQGVTIAEAARRKGIKRTTLRRYLTRVAEKGLEQPAPSLSA